MWLCWWFCCYVICIFSSNKFILSENFFVFHCFYILPNTLMTSASTSTWFILFISILFWNYRTHTKGNVYGFSFCECIHTVGHSRKLLLLFTIRFCLDCFSCGRDRVVILWDLSSGNTVRTLPVFEGLEGLVLFPPKFRLPGHKKKLRGGIHVATAGERGMYLITLWMYCVFRYRKRASLMQGCQQNHYTTCPYLHLFCWRSDYTH